MKKAQIITLSLCAVGAIALLVAGFVLYGQISRFGQASVSLTAAKARLEGFYREPVFPSADNVRRENENAVKLAGWFADLMAELRKGNIVSTEGSPSAFKSKHLEKTLEGLVQEAQAAGTELPANFGFGFSQYAGTDALPSPADVPPLMEQLEMVNRMCRILFANRIKALSAVERTAFENQPPKASTDAADAGSAPAGIGNARRPGVRRPGAQQPSAASPSPSARQPGVIPEGALFSKYRFVIEFSAKESALIGVLNALAASPSFVVVKVLRLNKGIPVLMPVTVEPAAAAGIPIPGFDAPTPPTAAPALKLGPSYPVSGLELEIPMQVRIELDVYKFKGDSDGSGD
jgi:hypothetical protein